MNFKRFSIILLAGVLLAACSGVEMVPAPQATPLPAQLQPATPAVQSPTHSQPSIRETPVMIAPFDETPNPNSDPVQPHATQFGQQPLPSFLPQPGDAKLQEGRAFVDRSELGTLKKDPYQAVLYLTGNLPTPCHQLRVKTAPPDSGNNIQVSVYTVFNPDMVCTQVLKFFEIAVPMDVLPAGTYHVAVNGEKVGDFTMP